MNINYHDKIKKLDLSKWVIIKFYHYASIVNDPDFYEYDEIWHTKPVGDPYIKELYNHFLSIANLYVGHDISDNKTTIGIKNIETKDELFITSKDGRYLIGNSVYSEFGYVTTFGVVKFESNDTVVKF